MANNHRASGTIDKLRLVGTIDQSFTMIKSEDTLAGTKRTEPYAKWQFWKEPEVQRYGEP